jgi:hypothetical protein
MTRQWISSGSHLDHVGYSPAVVDGGPRKRTA